MGRPRNKPTSDKTRLCVKCNIVKDINDFYLLHNPLWINKVCKTCNAERSRKYNYKNRDNLNVEEAETLRKKINICQICGSNKNLHIDHIHGTGKIRGILCFSCNAALGLLKDKRDLCLKAADYLDQAQA